MVYFLPSITQIGGYYGGEDNAIVPGSAFYRAFMKCHSRSHMFHQVIQLSMIEIWSLVYAIQDTTVV